MQENKYLSISEWCIKYGKNKTSANRWIHAGRLPAEKIGNQWAIPADAEPPADARVKTGAYKNWRKK